MEPRNIAKEIAEIARDYNYQQSPYLLVKLQEFVSAVVRALRDLLNLLHLPTAGDSDTKLVGNLLQILLMAAGIAVVIIVILMIARKLSHLEFQRKLARGGIIVGESSLDAAGWKAQAEALNDGGSYREACRALYMSALRRLDENKIAVFAPTKTNYEYIYSLKKWPAVASAFRPLVDNVELIWFGGKVAASSDYAASLSLLSSLENAIDAAARSLAVNSGGDNAGAAAP